jgi:hypothetical protein
MVAVGAGLIVLLVSAAVAAVLLYRRRLSQKPGKKSPSVSEAEAKRAADMFLDLDANFVAPPPPPAPRQQTASARGKKIGQPILVNTSAADILRGPGVIPAGPPPAIAAAADKMRSPKERKTKPKLSIAAYRAAPAPGVGGPTIVSPAPPLSPRYGNATPLGQSRSVPTGFSDMPLSATLAPAYAPSPRRVTSFDCAPSPLPTDARQRFAPSTYSDALPSPTGTAFAAATTTTSPFASPVTRSNTVGHRRTASRGSVNTARNSGARQAVYGQAGLNRLSQATSTGGDSFLSIPVSSRYSFDRDRWSGESRDVHGMI